MNNTSIEIKQYWRPDEVVIYFNKKYNLDISIKTVYRWCDEGVLDSIKIVGNVRITNDSIMDLEKTGDRFGLESTIIPPK